ncbi:MAG: hypothetical protein BGO55_03350 [Sphingobacteriales bacterium 50-39]|nr:hypothetical protein [Sphingobacteriales bacterium]OJW55590.1 MAG: hypothetical protein BGO55_03350 [Sphingobacteriales bacterium 50-39]
MDTLKKAKKITVKFFLNQLLEPATNDKGKEAYPLYIQVTYNRKNMQLKSKYAEYYYDLKEVKPGLMEFEERILQKIVTHEKSETKGEYDLKGLKRKYEVYSLSIHEAVEDYLKPKLRLAILKTNDELTGVLNFTAPQATTALLHKGARRLFPDFDRYLGAKLQTELAAYEQYRQLYKEPFFTYTFPAIIDWVDGSYRGELYKKLNAVYKNNPGAIKGIVALIEHAVTEKLRQLGE